MARTKGPKKTKRYPDEFKIRAVQLAEHPDILAKDVAEDLGVHPILLYRWRKEYREGKFKQDRRKADLRLQVVCRARHRLKRSLNCFKSNN